ncbi:DNA-(apurinic or apyrimidinic site) lyase 1 [Arthroderma uncinatum]|uniref:DNA-(apurinic or apyrimidinic site) lyase 1 n=1 Tax=Arthroderma uncinatum TaxID=74035 RepID=UPI00144A8A55|nr:DNA-(apurinic or apyrimidinic site) lyase 1 [Arthroderma uncinatum]KAF3484423.1 DNA-(apurinic or apyrimidinic site) lyase 1 [Arthroderma uncinatum]
MPSTTRSSRRSREDKPASTTAEEVNEALKSERKRGLSQAQAPPSKRPKKPSSTSEQIRSNSKPSVKGNLEDTDIAVTGDSKDKVPTNREADSIKEVKTAHGKKEEIVPAKTTVQRKRKVKEDTSTEMAPLASRATGLRMLVGAHVSAAKGVQNSISNSMHIGGNAFALFLKSQRKWDNPPLQDGHRDHFRKACAENNYDASKHILPHGSYLVNLAQEDPAKAKVAYTSFLDDLRRCEALGIKLYNFHPGATNKASLESSLSRLAKSLISALDATETVIPVLETMCGHGTTIGGPLSHFRDLFALIPESYHSRLGICVDTCHSFAAGYDLRTPTGWEKFMTEFDETIGLKFLRAWHLNDSKTPLGSNRDLHANIGTGFLGLRAFHNLMNDKRVEGMPMILETPIDRPMEDASENEQKGENEAVDSESGNDKKEKAKGKKKPTATKVAKGKKTIEDKSVWAREIKLLESLIGMDPESEEFLALEAKLAEEGKEERAKHQAMFDRKEKEKGGKTKDIRSMFAKGKTQRKGAARKKEESSEEESDEECGSGHE